MNTNIFAEDRNKNNCSFFDDKEEEYEEKEY